MCSPKKQIAFIHFTSIQSALQAVEAMQKEERYKGKRIAYGRDRSAYDKKGERDRDLDRMPPLALPPPSPPGPTLQAPIYPVDNFNRTVYLGGLHADTSYTEVLDAVRGGPVASCKLLADKNCAFVTFVDPESAMNFYRIASYRDGLTIHDQKARVGWGKPAPLPATVMGALARGASRNVYLGGIDVESVTESKLTSDLSAYGTVEKVNVISDKGIAFVNFTNIQSAVKAVAALRQDPFYSKFKINYGKDRCARH